MLCAVLSTSGREEGVQIGGLDGLKRYIPKELFGQY